MDIDLKSQPVYRHFSQIHLPICIYYSKLHERLEFDSIGNQLKELKQAFPLMDKDVVLAYHKARPEYQLHELAEYSHNKTKTFLESKYNEMLEEKKKQSEVCCVQTKELSRG